MSQPAYHHGNLRQALLDAGETLLETEGVAGVSLRALARATGVSHAAPYRHFADKDDLLAALAARGFARLTTALHDATRTHPGDLTARCLESCRRYIELGCAHPAMYRLMFGQRLHGVGDQPELAQAGQAAFDALLASMEEGRRAGVFRDEPVERLALAVWSMVHGLTELAIAGRLAPCGNGPEEGRGLGEAACSLLLRGLLTSDRGA